VCVRVYVCVRVCVTNCNLEKSLELSVMCNYPTTDPTQISEGRSEHKLDDQTAQQHEPITV